MFLGRLVIPRAKPTPSPSPKSPPAYPAPAPAPPTESPQTPPPHRSSALLCLSAACIPPLIYLNFPSHQHSPANVMPVLFPPYFPVLSFSSSGRALP
jgi:hypothetical protein